MGQYHDIDDILADEEVEPRSKVELPFWLASELHLRHATSVTIPPCFGKK
ncbi:putative GINS complex, subunit Psf3 superfamily protein [Helianthus annuus]|nr:putative GINS complex, subunit Psf3 superfamily protein [Helianthus annuus]